MIVKKLDTKLKFLFWNKEKKDYEVIIYNYYIGYYLFNKIPIYRKQIDCTIRYTDEEEDIVHQSSMYKKYGRLL